MKFFRTFKTTLAVVIFASGTLALSQSDLSEAERRTATEISPKTLKTSEEHKAEVLNTTNDRENGSEATDENMERPQSRVFLVTPIVMTSETGCWATLYDHEDFLGNQITLTGRQDLEDVEFDLKPYALGGEPDSVSVGPQATLELYGDEEFQDRDHVFTAGQTVANLKQTPFWDDVESVRLKCADGSDTAE
jgi:hypothetical protein